MNNSFVYFLIQLAVLMLASFMLVAAQDDNKLVLNNITLNNASLKNISINLSANNSTSFDANHPLMVGSEDNATFIISSKVIVVPTNTPKINITSQSSEIKPPKRTTFMIDFVRPGSSASYENRSLLNGAYLSRKVEGTPHGYVTYYN
jgi:hypothetical protein